MINRLNYEEFFLLYVDDELDHHQRAAVELFVQQNPDLAPEFEVLRETKIVAEPNLQFAEKNSLMKSEGIEINTSNYETYFLLYVDNELSENNKKEVEKFVLQHPQLQQEFTLLMQTVLEPETVEFTGKQTLYRKENERRIVPLYFSRIAVAAALIGLAVMVWWLLPSRKNNDVATVSPQIKNEQPVKEQPVNSATVKQEKQNNEVALNQPLVKKEGNNTINKTNNNTVKQQQPTVQNTVQQQNNVASDQNNTALNNETNNEQPVANNQSQAANNNTTIKNDAAINEAATVQHQNTETINELPAESAKEIFATNENNSNAINAQPAVYKVLDTDNSDRSLYIGSLELNKDRVRGFFKKVGSIFSNKSKNNNANGKLQVANMQFSTN